MWAYTAFWKRKKGNTKLASTRTNYLKAFNTVNKSKQLMPACLLACLHNVDGKKTRACKEREKTMMWIEKEQTRIVLVALRVVEKSFSFVCFLCAREWTTLTHTRIHTFSPIYLIPHRRICMAFSRKNFIVLLYFSLSLLALLTYIESTKHKKKTIENKKKCTLFLYNTFYHHISPLFS